MRKTRGTQPEEVAGPKPLPDYANPKSKHWDVIKLLNDDDCLAPDHLLQLPPPNFSYLPKKVNKKGDKKGDHADETVLPYDTERYDWHEDRESKPMHPSLVLRQNNGNLNNTLWLYYGDMSLTQCLPIAGLSSEVKDKMLSEARYAIMKIHNSSYNLFPNFKYDPNAEQEESFQAKPCVPLIMPDQIKATLVDDWENVTKNQQLVPLPHEHPVNAILAEYAEEEKKHRMAASPEADLLEEVVAGLKLYFEVALGRILLYR